jgi:hypothetical protein
MAEQNGDTTRRVVIDVRPRSVVRVAVAMGVACAISIGVATACLMALASVTGAHRSVDRLFSTVQRGQHLNTSDLLLSLGAGLALVVFVGTVLAGVIVALFANHVLPLAGGVAVDEEDPAPQP